MSPNARGSAGGATGTACAGVRIGALGGCGAAAGVSGAAGAGAGAAGAAGGAAGAGVVLEEAAGVALGYRRGLIRSSPRVSGIDFNEAYLGNHKH